MPATNDRRDGPGPSAPGDPDSLVEVDSADDFLTTRSGEDPGIISDWPELVEEEIEPLDEGVEPLKEEVEPANEGPANEGPAETAEFGAVEDLRKSIEELP